jgi:hypothetical protein
MSYFESDIIERAAHRFGHERTGFELVVVESVALPKFKVTLRLVVQTVKELAPLPEYILKATKIGLVDPRDIASYLGVDDRIAKSVVAELSQTECITFNREGGIARIAMTERGRRTLEAAEVMTPEEVRGSVFFDGLLRRPVADSGVGLLKPRELNGSGLTELPPMLSAKPAIEELSPGTVREVFRVPSRPYEGVKRRELLSVREIERSERLFMPALALVYKAVGGTDVQVGFVIHDTLSGPHERAFAKGDGPRSTGLAKQALTAATVSDAAVQVIGEAAVHAAADVVAVARAQKQVAEATREIEQAEEALEDAEDDAAQRAAERAITEAHRVQEAAEEELSSYTVRVLNTYDHPRFLDDALLNSTSRLLIISPWIRRAVMTATRMRRLQLLLVRGVEVFIGYGIEEDESRDPLMPDDLEAGRALEELAKQHDNFHFVRLGDEHSKVLLSDTKYMIVGSFNWLSFRGDRRKRHRGERSILCTSPAKIDAIFEEVTELFGLSRTRRARIQLDKPEVSPTAIRKAADAELARSSVVSPVVSPKQRIGEGESKAQEFKSTFRWNIKANKIDAAITFSSLKTIAAFLNTDGGALWIGINDDGAPVGVAEDRFDNEDKYLLHVTHCVRESMGEHAATLVDPQFVTVDNTRVVVVECERSTKAVYLKTKQSPQEEFFVRAGPGTVKMPISEAYQYIRGRFGD